MNKSEEIIKSCDHGFGSGPCLVCTDAAVDAAREEEREALLHYLGGEQVILERVISNEELSQAPTQPS